MDNKEYSSHQYQVYCDYMDKLANESVISKNATIHIELMEWIEQNNLSPNVIEQMDKEMMQIKLSGE